MKSLVKFLPYLLLLLLLCIIYREFVVFGKVPLPADTLVGAYYPWLDYKWGFPVGVPVKNALTSDAFSTFFVWKKIMVDMYSSGVIPLWNQFSLSGTPLLATFHSTVFNPANILLFIPRYGWSLYIFMSSVVAAFSMYLFLGINVKNKIARIIGALIFAFSGPMTTWAEFGTAVWAAALLPLILFFINKALAEDRPYQYFMITILSGLMVFCGHVQLLTYSAVIIPCYSLFLLKNTSLVPNFRKIIYLILSLALGLGIGAIQLLPVAEFYQSSIRSSEKYSSFFNFGLSPLSESVRLFAADFYGHPTTGNHFSSVSYHEYSSYLGVLTIPLIIYFFVSGAISSEAIFFLAVFGLSLFLSFDNFISRSVLSLPIPLLTYSSVSRLFFITGFSGAILASLGVDKLILKNSKGHLLVVAIILISFIAPLYFINVDVVNRSVAIRNLVFYEGMLLSFAAFIYIFRKKSQFLLLGLLILFTFDLGRYFNKYNTFVENKLVFPTTPVIDFLVKQPKPFRIARENTNLFPANTWGYYGLESVEGYDPLYSLEYAKYFHLLNGTSYKNTVSRYALLDRLNVPFLSAQNVKYYLSLSPVPEKYGFKPVFTDGKVTIYENPDALKRAYFAGKVTLTDTADKVYEEMSRDGFDPRWEVVTLAADLSNNDLSSGEVTKILDENGQVVINTHNQKDGVLVLADSYNKGWVARINDQSTKIYQVNSSLMAVKVPAGDNLIEFKYLPKSFTNGLSISLVSLCISIIFVIIYPWLSKKLP